MLSVSWTLRRHFARQHYLYSLIHTLRAPRFHSLEISYNTEYRYVECDAYKPGYRREGSHKCKPRAKHLYTIMPVLAFEHTE